MFKLRYLDAARNDLLQIAENIARISGSRDTGLQFAQKLNERCRELADKPFKLGQPRTDLGIDFHSRAYGDYLIFFQYDDDTLEVVKIVHGRRDLGVLFDDLAKD